MSLILANPASNVLLQAKQGATNQWRLTFTTQGQPYDLTPYRVRMSVKRVASLEAASVWTGDTDDGTITVGGNDQNVLTVTIPSNASLPSGNFFFDLRFEDETTDEVAYYMQGRFDCDPSATTGGQVI